MPGLHGTGPRGQGAMTGRGLGYCSPGAAPAQSKPVPYRYAGLQGTPVGLGGPYGAPVGRPRFWRLLGGFLGRRGGARGRGRGLAPRDRSSGWPLFVDRIESVDDVYHVFLTEDGRTVCVRLADEAQIARPG